MTTSQARLFAALVATLAMGSTGAATNDEPCKDEPDPDDVDRDCPRPPRYRKLMGELGPYPRGVVHGKCPKCKKRVSVESRSCPHCGENLIRR